MLTGQSVRLLKLLIPFISKLALATYATLQILLKHTQAKIDSYDFRFEISFSL
jgi:hypothetical protein